jgi:hypothetical protein
MDNPHVLKLFHRHSVWMLRISVLVKVNGNKEFSVGISYDCNNTIFCM